MDAFLERAAALQRQHTAEIIEAERRYEQRCVWTWQPWSKKLLDDECDAITLRLSLEMEQLERDLHIGG